MRLQGWDSVEAAGDGVEDLVEGAEDRVLLLHGEGARQGDAERQIL